jgi:hypothetical protein
MEFVYRRSYRGRVKLVVQDWAGTTLDYGCYAPAVVFIEVYKRRGVEIEALDPQTLERKLARARERLAQSGAHYVVDGIADLLPVISDIEARLARGERP